MKPILVYVEDGKDTITLTKEQLEKYISDAYQQGYCDGGYYLHIPYIEPIPYTPPNPITNPIITYSTDTLKNN